MIKPMDLPETLPVFPLPGALLLPRSCLPLHIFEPRYLTMLEDVLKTPQRLIGMIQPVGHQREHAGEPGLQRIGCAGRVTQFSETEDGRYMVTLTGVSRFRFIKEIEGFTPYRRTQISWDGFDRDRGEEEADQGLNRDGFLSLLTRYFTSQGLQADWETLQDAAPELLVNSLSMLLEFDSADKQALLEAPCLRTRRETLVTLLEFSMRGGDEEEILQ